MEEEVLSSEVAKLRRKRLYEGTKDPGLPSLPPEAIADTLTTTPLPSFVSNIYSEASEKELLYFLLKFGEKPLFLDAENNTINAAEYIISELRNDDLELQNLLYRKIFDEYIQILKSQNEDCLKHFINHPNQNIMELAINVLSDNYQLSIESYIKSEEPEDVKLRRVIPYSIAAYKSDITKQAFAAISEQLNEAQKLNDSEQVLLLLERLRTLQPIRNSFAKNLHRLTT
jgi:DNA primase